MPGHHFDLVVIGSGPAGQKGAIAAAKLGKSPHSVKRKLRLIRDLWAKEIDP